MCRSLGTSRLVSELGQSHTDQRMCAPRLVSELSQSHTDQRMCASRLVNKLNQLHTDQRIAVSVGCLWYSCTLAIIIMSKGLTGATVRGHSRRTMKPNPHDPGTEHRTTLQEPLGHCTRHNPPKSSPVLTDPPNSRQNFTH